MLLLVYCWLKALRMFNNNCSVFIPRKTVILWPAPLLIVFGSPHLQGRKAPPCSWIKCDVRFAPIISCLLFPSRLMDPLRLRPSSVRAAWFVRRHHRWAKLLGSGLDFSIGDKIFPDVIRYLFFFSYQSLSEQWKTEVMIFRLIDYLCCCFAVDTNVWCIFEGPRVIRLYYKCSETVVISLAIHYRKEKRNIFCFFYTSVV